MKNYSGQPSNITTPLAATLVQITDTTPPVAQTTAAHNYATNDYVYIDGNSLITSDVPHQITVIDSTHFSFNGVVGGGGPAVAGGTTRDISLTPYFGMADDGEYATTQSIEAAIEAVADRTQFLALMGHVRSVTWTTTTSWTSPVDGYALVGGYGGGGGGGGGYGNGTAANTYGVGGGAGGAALQSWQLVQIFKGHVYDAIIGAGGAGGAGGAAGNNNGNVGSNGTDSTFVDDASSAVLARFTGAGRGFGAVGGATGTQDPSHMTWGGPGTKQSDTGGDANFAGETSDANSIAGTNQAQMTPIKGIAQGGFGQTNAASQNSNAARGMWGPVANVTVGSTGGTNGTDAGAQLGGGRGGGGGNGPGGAGGNGGNGGNGSAGTGAAGTAGAAAAANSGAGGGGGGAGGTGAVAGGAGGDGGAGGSGKLTIVFVGSILT